jgi:N,N'-diacetyllegionaminate synthase
MSNKNPKTLRIDKRLIGDGQSCYVIAEAGANFRISDNPEENLAHALRLIDLAAEAKADAVKFQLYREEKIYVKDAGYATYIGKKKSINEIIKEMELPFAWLPELKKHCDERGITFLCSPFDEGAVDALEKIRISAYKIASYTISHHSFLKYIARSGKPIILSTGAADLKDVEEAIQVIKSTGNEQIAVLQCTAKYPAPPSSLNLRTIPFMKAHLKVPIGLSDHSREPLLAPIMAVTLGACIIEKHFTTDNTLPGPDHGFAVLADELKDMVAYIRATEAALGTGMKTVLDEEGELHSFCRRAIFSIKVIRTGDILTRDNIACLRPGKKQRGIGAEEFESVLGKIAKRTIKENEAIKPNDF